MEALAKIGDDWVVGVSGDEVEPFGWIGIQIVAFEVWSRSVLGRGVERVAQGGGHHPLAVGRPRGTGREVCDQLVAGRSDTASGVQEERATVVGLFCKYLLVGARCSGFDDVAQAFAMQILRSSDAGCIEDSRYKIYI